MHKELELYKELLMYDLANLEKPRNATAIRLCEEIIAQHTGISSKEIEHETRKLSATACWQYPMPVGQRHCRDTILLRLDALGRMLNTYLKDLENVWTE
jgi:hypothetical protein